MKIGTLVRITAGDPVMGDTIVGWYKTSSDIHAHIFPNDIELYGLFLGRPITSNLTLWYEVLVNDKIYLFMMKQLKEHV